VRLEPFTVVFKAQDKGLPVPLVNFKTVFIAVNAPAPENLESEALGNGVNLKWDKSTCENAIGYKIYRRSGESGWEPGSCETGVPLYTGFKKIAEVNNINTLTYRDENLGAGLVHGINYCYRVTAFFIDDAESIASNETCAYLKRDVPIITHVSNDSTDLEKGNALVIWSKPIELDTIQYPGPYKYILYRNNGLEWDSPVKVAEFEGLNDTIFLDESVNMNTNDKPYSYRVDLESLTVGFIGSSQKASAVFIRTTPSDQEIILEGLTVVPWQNDRFIIYRKSPGEDTFDSLGTTSLALYRDQGLENGKTYCYVVKAIGHYSLPGLIDPLINFSQIACQDPTDNVPPCQPVLTVETNCEEVTNVLTWTLPYDSCKQDVAEYQVFFAPSEGEPLDLIETITNPFDTTFSHTDLANVVGCYAVTAIDSVGNVSDTSNIVCVNYDACPPYELPNVFTPNGDGYNDLFVPITDLTGNPKANVDRVDMTIFNRWGKIMYTTTDPQINWDGKNQNNNEDCANGVYFYVCEVYIITLTGEETFTLKGSVSIYRGE
jgi:gliding motility-associated-like protein